MKPVVKNVLAVIVGLVVGSCVNLGLVYLGAMFYPLPEGTDLNNSESLAAAIGQLEWQGFVFPFLAHAIGTLAGAATTGCLATGHRFSLAMAIGFIFLVGGIINILTIPHPVWFVVVDLALAYLPMAWLGATWTRGCCTREGS